MDKEKLQKLDQTKLKKALPKINYKVLNHAKYYYMDAEFESTTLTNFRKILQKDFTNWRIYNKDFDCDNFAFKLYSNLRSKYPKLTIGVVLNSKHAYNVFVDKYGKAWYIEPQTDKVQSYSKLAKQYKPISLIIL